MTFFHQDQQLEQLAAPILEQTWAKFPEIEPNGLALTWIVYETPVIVNTGGAISPEEFWKHPLKGYNYRGSESLYPASIVKLFYLVAIQEWLESRMVTTSPELERAIADMIVNSSNDATSLIVDVLTGTTSGPELSPGPFETWKYQRNLINRYFKSLGWPELGQINVNQKTWGDGPYGRERAFLGEMFENRNIVTTNAVARLLHSIIGGVAVSPERSQTMMKLLKRELTPSNLSQENDENQIFGFLGGGLPQNSQIWSKAGWTSQVRHDAAYIELPDGKPPYLLVVFTQGKEISQNRQILPFISRSFAEIIAHLT
jgi:beta-lactamase class A